MNNTYRIYILIVITLFITESVINFVDNRKNYFTKDMASNIFIGIGLILLSNISKIFVLGVYGFIYKFRMLTTGNIIGIWILCFFANDLTFYFYHVVSHKTKWFWSVHSVHHSSEHYNISTAFRQSWFAVLNGYWIFWLWMPLLGFHPLMIITVYQLAMLYQTWLHTELISKLPSPVEFIFNTPSHHRVHHATNPQYIDKNMGAVLIIWDRMFGTYAAEVEKPVYGITKPVKSLNPLVILAKGIVDFFSELQLGRWLSIAHNNMFKKPAEAFEHMLLQRRNLAILKSVLFTIPLLIAALFTRAQTLSATDPGNHSKKMQGTSIWGEINLGNSNYGFLGQGSLNYRIKNRFISAGISKSHLCYQGEYNGIGFPDTRMCVNHITIVSYFVSGGIMLPGKLCPSISCGISVTQFTYKQTTPETSVLSLLTLWETVIGGDGMDNVLNTHNVMAIGIPIEFRIHLAQRHTLGFDAGIKVDLNTERPTWSAQLGIRFGKIVKKT